MFCLSQSVGHAIKALCCLEQGCAESRTIEEVAGCSGAPRPYLAKLVRKLVDAGLLASRRGIGGGAWLNRAPEAITLLDISEAIDGREALDRCLLGFAECSDARSCPTHAFWKVERERIRQTLHKTTLADVIAFEKARGANLSGASPAHALLREKPANAASPSDPNP